MGAWLMAAPAVLGYIDTTAADLHRVIGPVAASAAVVAVWEASRGVRLVNIILGVLLVGAPLVVGHPADAAANGVVSGALLAAASPFGGRSRQTMAGGWRSLSGQP